MADESFMRRALVLAREGWGQTAPNPMVGAVVVAGDEIVGEGFHARFGEAHAEVSALHAAGARARGATLYVTLEPCAHHGKTPPCVDAIIAAGIARVVVAVRDPTAVAGGGGERLRAAGIFVDFGVERAAALELNAPFFNAQVSERPWITLKLALSAEGAIADATRSPRWLTGSLAREEVHRLRAGSDAIAVGVGTALTDDPALTVRESPRPRVAPRRIVFDSTLRIPAAAALVRTAREIETIIVASSPSSERAAILERSGVVVLTSPTLDSALRALRARGIRSLLIEGGAQLAGSVLNASLVDRLVIFQTTVKLGEGALEAFAFAGADAIAAIEGAPVLERRALGADVMVTYAMADVPCSPD
jgi:diaminohydroxyphosphoribosylaminopyrimidine deaminase / 5-amino-6-(5-phosphoribosylamino)uracil reductase